jgi:hypothetical protein
MIINPWSVKARIIDTHPLHRQKKMEIEITLKKKVRNSRIIHKEMNFEMSISFL